ncbi:6-phosphogluconolactonase [Microbacterium invictum]|uniref:6-phosphogluconolactonase n=1 Tax=Microbacterium invictum TaxID=515415 RepID=A0AA40SN68_9MICO|nr:MULTISPECIES: 6-phosphogluconolactonase [Microbacterium]MBB4139316.1 6-phosphogluconolactonase [Microbacterium invictum]
MAEFWTEKRVVISPDAAELVTSVAARFFDRIGKRTGAGKTAHIALTGGVIGTEVLRAIGADPARHDIDWSSVHLWWGDEVFAPWDSAERNHHAARVLLDAIDIPTANVHPMPSSDDVADIDDAASAYAAELARFGDDERAWPTFDVCFLGVGPDAHIAALFPDRAEIQVVDRAVVAVRDSPKPPSLRLTLTRPVLNSSRRVWMVIAGDDKAAALGLALAGASYESVPAAGAKGRKRTILFVDRAAAAQVPAELIDQEY